jgi:hypothetical protein
VGGRRAIFLFIWSYNIALKPFTTLPLDALMPLGELVFLQVNILGICHGPAENSTYFGIRLQLVMAARRDKRRLRLMWMPSQHVAG